MSRMSHRCEVHRQLVGIDATINLFLTLPPVSRSIKKTRGCLRIGLVEMFTQRLRTLILGDGSQPFASQPKGGKMHVAMTASFPQGHHIGSSCFATSLISPLTFHFCLFCLYGAYKIILCAKEGLSMYFPKPIHQPLDCTVIASTLRHSLQCLTRQSAVSDDVAQFLREQCAPVHPVELADYNSVLLQLTPRRPPRRRPVRPPSTMLLFTLLLSF